MRYCHVTLAYQLKAYPSFILDHGDSTLALLCYLDYR